MGTEVLILVAVAIAVVLVFAIGIRIGEQSAREKIQLREGLSALDKHLSTPERH